MHKCKYCDIEAPLVTGPIRGSYYCATHLPSTCRFCHVPIEWFDGDACDWCDRYAGPILEEP